MRETLGVPLSTTHTAPGVVATPSGCGPTGIGAPTELSRGSMRKTVSSDTREIHTASLPVAASPQLPGSSGHALCDLILMRATTAFFFGSMRISAETVSLVVQTAPPP